MMMCLHDDNAVQVCILIDPNMTMADANSSAGGIVDSAAPPPEVDTQKLVQVSSQRLTHVARKPQNADVTATSTATQ
jgi:hypothetical protein